ncbi:MAG: hypothetical protein WA197_07515 [Candidatus Acidiferrales bacterium]
MDRYRYLLGKRVEVHYQSGDFYLSCVGTLASDDGESIVVHEQFSSGGSQKTMRVEIPYSYIVRASETLLEPLHVIPSSPRGRVKRR